MPGDRRTCPCHLAQVSISFDTNPAAGTARDGSGFHAPRWGPVMQPHAGHNGEVPETVLMGVLQFADVQRGQVSKMGERKRQREKEQ